MNALTLEIVKTSEIEGEALCDQQVRSSTSRHSEINNNKMLPVTNEIDAVVEMITLEVSYN